MRRSSCHHAEVDHARRLAELTIQPNVEEVLLCIAEEFDRLADDFATGEVDSTIPRFRNIREAFSVIFTASSPDEACFRSEDRHGTRPSVDA
jgi:hypothetical protein